ncbi:hypothetical protein SAMN04488126_10891 [Bhargavaea beijingensis]|uniref:Uncharacterized protein n=1 Tax=Bhargavaea beijingensis TaxID=426756 RepID=A0A1G7CRI1_9BACL|nr:hypothetical protein SAMN04488126_10891 [Bhargavaea beijingensis]
MRKQRRMKMHDVVSREMPATESSGNFMIGFMRMPVFGDGHFLQI